MSVVLKTKAEQKVEWLESLDRPLSDDERRDLKRALHAIDMRHWRARRAESEMNADALVDYARIEAETLEAVTAAKRLSEPNGCGQICQPATGRGEDWQRMKRRSSVTR